MKTNKTSSPTSKVAYFVTSNIHKFQEARKILSEYGLAVAKLKVEAVEIQDNSLENIAKYSVNDAVKRCGLPIFVEDSGIFVDALNGFPGPYSRYIHDTVGIGSIIKLMENNENRAAHFRSVVAFASPKTQPTCFVGRVDGKISLRKRGTGGFGYDPIFVPLEGDGRTFGEMTMTEKNRFSHRARALRKFGEWYQGC
jgi:XTP/dITP diphosphohydrolase